jgi:hypothetical protein
VVESYLVWGTWFPNRLPLEGTGPYLDFFGRNWRPRAPTVQDLDKIDLVPSEEDEVVPPPTVAVAMMGAPSDFPKSSVGSNVPFASGIGTSIGTM